MHQIAPGGGGGYEAFVLELQQRAPDRIARIANHFFQFAHGRNLPIVGKLSGLDFFLKISQMASVCVWVVFIGVSFICPIR